MKCDAYRILIREMLQGRLDLDEATLVSGHLDACDDCRSFHQDLVAASPARQEPVAPATAQPTAPTGRLASVWPTVAALALAVLLLGGLVVFAVGGPGGWAGHPTGRTPHHQTVQHRCR